MENYNKSRLPLVYTIFTAACLFSIAIQLVNYTLINNNNINYVTDIFSLACAGVIAWAAISGKKAGVSVLGTIGGWIYAVCEIMLLGMNLYRNFLWTSYSYDEISSISQICNIIYCVIWFICIASFSLFAIGSKTWLPLKIALPAFYLLAFVTDLLAPYIGVSYGYFATRLIIIGVCWMAFLALSIIWLIRKK